MWEFINIDIKGDHVTRSAGTALLCTILTQRLSDRRPELQSLSETLCWIILPIVFKTATASTSAKYRKTHSDVFSWSDLRKLPTSTLSLWIVAFSLTIYWYFAEENGLIIFLPVLTPLLLVPQSYPSWADSDISAAPSSLVSRVFYCFCDTAWGSVSAALFTAVTFKWDWHIQASDAVSFVPVAALLVAYLILEPRPRISNSSYRLFQSFDLENAILPLSLRVTLVLATLLSMETLAFGSPGMSAYTPALALTKALSWYFTTQTARHSSWRIATAMTTYSIASTSDPFTLSSNLRAFCNVVASFLSLSQIIHMLPKQAKAKSALWAFFLVSFVPYLTNIFILQFAQPVSSLAHPQDHPVQNLIQNAKLDFDNLIQKQSKTYAAAQDEYRRRYSLKPPAGFETWFKFAKSHQSPIIDEFDMIYESIAPFWELSGQEVLDAMSRAQNTPGSDLWLCSLSGREARTVCTHPYRIFDRHIQSSFEKLLGDLRGYLPDIKFLVNHIDEPRVLIPRPGSTHESGVLTLDNMSRRPVWDTLTSFCSYKGGNRTSDQTRHMVDDFGLPFVTDPISSLDLCQHPEYSTAHGLLMSPSSFPLLEGMVPVLSTGSLSTMGDIVYPSPAYLEDEFRYNDAHDIGWDSKRNHLYWAGSNTGGHAPDGQWRYFHRQRFVELAQNLNRREHYYLRETDGVLSRVKSYFLNSRLFDVAFTRIFQCERPFCRNQRAYFNLRPWEDKDRALESRLVFDMDGNGISGRYYKFLASQSAPLKQTLLREWHDERLIPWIHYIPVSQGMEELPELVLHLTSTEAGQEAAKHVAEQGREWFGKAFREVDRTIYVYRLLLELARLQDPARPRMAPDNN
ncbi:uncharacterized protein J7T55_013398 [Diaporthe amygdali]|uniref:uncharacterized protein n=1 Tax=Phomopsis amygdali TaxID=1214568 RepID=UPI0022FE9BF5|nr:uncharacterized protein J7T55_013398 [Diaporthe amygdali]KAJ0119162.1 uncharacterized protein J7T55_013398 [Diaporthe amygdali]